jgi:kexin
MFKKMLKITLIALLGQLLFYCTNKKEEGLNPLLFLALVGSRTPSTPRSCDLTPLDPLYNQQWHIKNTGQSGGTAGQDANVEPVWNSSNWGRDIYVAVVDDGVDIEHPDLQLTYLTGHWDYVDNDNDPRNNYQQAKHGTSVAGVIGARCNDKGVRGIAPLADILGYNLLLAPTSSNIADAMTRNKDIVRISNNSWGATDTTGKLDDSFADSTWKLFILDGIQNGAGGKGIVYLWAAGNGGSHLIGGSPPILIDPVDNSNYDGQASYVPFVNAICAVTNQGKRAYYSEKGANLLVCGYSNYFYNEGTLAITTTDIRGSDGYNTSSTGSDYTDKDYTKTFGGTSSATPLVSGVVALMLQANPNLTWRDVRYILVKTAKQVDSGDTDWKTNAAGLKFNHKYGFGVVDANAAVNMAKTFSSFGGYSSLLSHTTIYDSPNLPIPDNDPVVGIPRTINVSTTITKIEGVQIEVQFSHTFFGELEITLTSPSGTIAKLAEQHDCDDNSDGTIGDCPNYSNKTWVFGANIFMDENPNGNWTLTVKDLGTTGTGTLHQWRIQIYGR